MLKNPVFIAQKLMMQWIKVLDNLPENDGMIQIKLYGKKISIAYNQNTYYAFASTCPHAGADLSRGWCKEGYIICPVHRYGYCLKTGKGKAGQGDYLRTYPLKIEAHGVFIQIKKPWWMIW